MSHLFFVVFSNSLFFRSVEMISSIYYEALWVVALFAATATLREAIGELCVHVISHSILSCSHISGKTLDVFISCSNGGRSLGFGAAWRMWNVDNSGVIPKWTIILPFGCWMVGMPIKLVAVQAVRGGNEFLGFWYVYICTEREDESILGYLFVYYYYRYL